MRGISKELSFRVFLFKVVFQCMVFSLKRVINIIIITLLCLFMFAVIGVHLFQVRKNMLFFKFSTLDFLKASTTVFRLLKMYCFTFNNSSSDMFRASFKVAMILQNLRKKIASKEIISNLLVYVTSIYFNTQPFYFDLQPWRRNYSSLGSF